MKTPHALIDAALSCGFSGATLLPAAEIVTDRAFRDTCSTNRCGLYGKCWTCPPDVGDIDLLIKTLYGYSQALLYQTIVQLEDSYDIEGMSAGGARHAKQSRILGKKILPLLGTKAMNLSCGGCRFCDRCAKQDGLPCRAPSEALASLEAYGVDVYQTVKKTELKYVNGQNTVTYFGMILF